MTGLRRLSVGACAVMLSACTSSLEVRRLDSIEANGATGVPVYLPLNEFLVTELGLDKNGRAAGEKNYQVTLVTRKDPRRGFLIKNNPAWLSTSSFSITRTTEGVISAVSGSSEEQFTETVKALATFVSALPVPISGAEDQKAALQQELIAQASIRDALIEELGEDDASDPEKTKMRQDALDAAVKRIAEIHIALNALDAPSQGLKPSGRRRADVYPVASEAERDTKLEALANAKDEGTEPSFVVFLLPAQ